MKRTANLVALAYFAIMFVVVTFPGIRPFNTLEPRVFGLPFVFAWTLAWVAGSIFVFLFLYKAHNK